MSDRAITIEDPDDPRIAVFRDIRERDLAGRSGFIAEGAVVLDLLLVSQRFRPTALLILRNRLAGMAERLRSLADTVPVYVAERDCFDRIAGFPVHRGILAHGEAVQDLPDAGPLLAAVRGSRKAIVVAVGIANHDNLGAIFRECGGLRCGVASFSTRLAAIRCTGSRCGCRSAPSSPCPGRGEGRRLNCSKRHLQAAIVRLPFRRP